MRRWEDVVPPDVAMSQRRWERDKLAQRLNEEYPRWQIGKWLGGISPARVGHLIWRAKEKGNELSPVEKYLRTPDGIVRDKRGRIILTGKYGKECNAEYVVRPKSWTGYIIQPPGVTQRREWQERVIYALGCSYYDVPPIRKWDTTTEYLQKLLAFAEAFRDERKRLEAIRCNASIAGATSLSAAAASGPTRYHR